MGQEDTSPLIIDFVENLLQVPKEINFYMHAGETNWFGSIDENLVSFQTFLANLIVWIRSTILFYRLMLYCLAQSVSVTAMD